ncbi:hypothetical protein ACHAWO_009830 [Cyclotella atomus]|uniref:Uncharacterized protein n=1 Tax=Cyclotella atomus TaxID=382360 RepID=A0ABD3QM15_9STRA
MPHEDHDPLTSLACLVSATIRDKVVLDQMNEIAALKSQLASTRLVEITGPAGSPILASGSLADGEFNTEACDEDGDCGVLWSVGLYHNTTSSKNMGAVPMHQLANIEIRIGGVLYATSDDIDGTKIALGIRKGNTFDIQESSSSSGGIDKKQKKCIRGMHRSAVCEFTNLAYLTFHMTNFPRGEWRSLRSLNMHNRSISIRNEERAELGEEEEEESEAMDMYSYITERLAVQHPRQMCEISSVSFCVENLKDAIGSLRRGKEFEREKERYLYPCCTVCPDW